MRMKRVAIWVKDHANFLQFDVMVLVAGAQAQPNASKIATERDYKQNLTAFAFPLILSRPSVFTHYTQQQHGRRKTTLVP